jgi:hypothetical protein
MHGVALKSGFGKYSLEGNVLDLESETRKQKGDSAINEKILIYLGSH